MGSLLGHAGSWRARLECNEKGRFRLCEGHPDAAADGTV